MNQTVSQTQAAANSPRVHKVAVFVVNSTAKVVPGHLIVAPGERIEIRSLGIGLRVFLPDSSPFTNFLPSIQPVGNGGIIMIDSKTKGSFQVIDKPPKIGRYPYAVYCEESAAFATGGSDPEIIILD